MSYKELYFKLLKDFAKILFNNIYKLKYNAINKFIEDILKIPEVADSDYGALLYNELYINALNTLEHISHDDSIYSSEYKWNDNSFNNNIDELLDSNMYKRIIDIHEKKIDNSDNPILNMINGILYEQCINNTDTNDALEKIRYILSEYANIKSDKPKDKSIEMAKNDSNPYTKAYRDILNITEDNCTGITDIRYGHISSKTGNFIKHDILPIMIDYNSQTPYKKTCIEFRNIIHFFAYHMQEIDTPNILFGRLSGDMSYTPATVDSLYEYRKAFCTILNIIDRRIVNAELSTRDDSVTDDIYFIIEGKTND